MKRKLISISAKHAQSSSMCEQYKIEATSATREMKEMNKRLEEMHTSNYMLKDKVDKM